MIRSLFEILFEEGKIILLSIGPFGAEILNFIFKASDKLNAKVNKYLFSNS